MGRDRRSRRRTCARTRGGPCPSPWRSCWAASSSTRRGRRSERPLLCRALSLAVLLAVSHPVVRPPDLRRRPARRLAAHHRDRVAGVPHPGWARPLPADLLLLPQGLLPLVLAGPRRLRGARREVRLHRRDALSPAAPELPPLYVVRGDLLHRGPGLGCAPGLPLSGARRDDRFGIGVGTIVMWINVVLLAGYTFSCHSCRHVCGGHVNAFSKAPRATRSGASSRGSTSATPCSRGSRCSAWA